MKKFKLLLLAALAVTAITAFVGCGKKKKNSTINLNNYLTITEAGYDNYGRVIVDFDEEKFKADNKGKIKFKAADNEAKLAYMLSGSDDMGLFLDYVDSSAYAKNNKNLSNNDNVTIEWSFDEEDVADIKNYFGLTLGKNLTYTNQEYVVSNLEKAEEFNPFDHITVSFGGAEGNCYIEINEENIDELDYASFEYNFDKYSVKNGDKVVINVVFSSYLEKEDFINKYNKIFVEGSKEYTISGLSKYVTTKNDITEDMYNKMDQTLRDVFTAEFARDNCTKYFKDMTLLGNYVLNIKNPSSMGYGDYYNYVYFVYKITLKDGFTYYYTGYYRNVMLLSDGTCTTDLSDYRIPYNTIKYYADDSYWGNYLDGVANLDSLFNKYVTSYIDSYSYENTVVES